MKEWNWFLGVLEFSSWPTEQIFSDCLFTLNICQALPRSNTKMYRRVVYENTKFPFACFFLSMVSNSLTEIGFEIKQDLISDLNWAVFHTPSRDAHKRVFKREQAIERKMPDGKIRTLLHAVRCETRLLAHQRATRVTVLVRFLTWPFVYFL